MPTDPQGYPVQQYTNLKGSIVQEILSDGTIVLITGVTISSGSGSPAGVVTAPVGSWYIDKNGISPNIWYQKQVGVDNNGWVAVASGSGAPAAPSTAVQFNNGGSFGGDANLEWDNTNKRLQIGGGALISPIGITNGTDSIALGSIATPIDAIEIHTSDSFVISNYRVGGLSVYSHLNNTGPCITFAHSLGTQALPLTLTNGSVYTRVNFVGYDGTVYATAGRLDVTTSETWNATSHGTQMNFSVVKNTTVAVIVALTLNNDASATFFAPVKHGAFTVALLPTGVEGQLAYATNGRKVGEGAGLGTGVPVYFSNGSWRVFSTDAAVAA